MESKLPVSLASFFFCALTDVVASVCPARLMEELPFVIIDADGPAATSLLVGMPGSILIVGSEIVVPPSRPSKREIKLSRRACPPTSPHGIQTL